jgi:23S rRNA (adenine2503-C2)-methyltransferase
MTETNTLLDLDFSEIEAGLQDAGIKAVHARALWRFLYRDPHLLAHEKKPLPQPLINWLQGEGNSHLTDKLLTVTEETRSSDLLTQKWLLKLRDGEQIETVLMGYPGRHTVCISTQAGCAMGCVFCATGQSGFVRHLTVGEILSQLLHVQKELRSRGASGLRNIVLMGMGEPLHNYDAVMKAMRMASDSRGLNIGPGRISISTVGVVPGILRMAEEQQPYNLAVSLHGANEADRARLVPVSKRWPLEDLIRACRTYGEKTGRRIFFGWTLIAGENDSEPQARELSELLEGLDAHVNLIPLNPTGGYVGEESQQEAAGKFQKILREKGIPCTFRQRRGIDVAAGCGQLRTQNARKYKH